VGLNAREPALQKIGPDIAVEIPCQPFELNPTTARAATPATATCCSTCWRG
jgi:hypothetical protein